MQPEWRDQYRVAVLIVNYRTPDLTIACVESVINSAGVHPRVVVVDNASGDDSVERLEARFLGVASVTIHRRSTNDGYAGGNNAGIAIARAMQARYALILNSDTIIDPSCIRLLIAEAAKAPDVALVAPRIFFGSPPDRLWFGGGRYALWAGRPVHVGYRQLAAHGWAEARDLPFAPGCALLVRLDLVAARENGLFDASLFSYFEDVELSLRIRRDGRRIRYVPDALVWHFEGASHRRAGGQALRFYLNTRNLLRVTARYARWYHWPTLAPMLAVNVIGRYCAVAVRDRDPAALAAVLRGVMHAFTGGRHDIEPDARARSRDHD